MGIVIGIEGESGARFRWQREQRFIAQVYTGEFQP
jgi:hypothetical protein